MLITVLRRDAYSHILFILGVRACFAGHFVQHSNNKLSTSWDSNRYILVICNLSHRLKLYFI
ncbi:MAG: hypothetical protein U9Q83_06985, partial [Bacteroidota bacterium]|nr:hypothetical protein [Bacteroidota bacterium]